MEKDIQCPCSYKETIQFITMSIDEKIEEISTESPKKQILIKNYKINNNKRYRLF